MARSVGQTGRAREASRVRPVLLGAGPTNRGSVASPPWSAAAIGDTSAARCEGRGLEQSDDLALIGSIARRDREAFETLYYRYAPRLGRYAFKLLQRREAVDEVINDVMLAVWNGAARFDAGVSSLSAWLYGITHNKALKALARRAPRAREIPLEPEGEETAPQVPAGHDRPSHDPERAAMGRQLGAALSGAVGRLSAEHRAVIELAFGEGLSYAEIASVMGCPVNTVKTRMFHARKRLAGFLEERAGSSRSSLP